MATAMQRVDWESEFVLSAETAGVSPTSVTIPMSETRESDADRAASAAVESVYRFGREDEGGVGEVREGAQVGPYRLLQPLGAGSQAVVWKAVRMDGDHEIVAIKLMKPMPGRQASQLARFRREGERGMRLDHPAILRVRECGFTGGLVYMSMPLVRGTSLRTIMRLRRGVEPANPLEANHWLVRMPPGDYVWAIQRVMLNVVRGLAAAHEAGVVHRDIKPENILIDARESGGVYLADFGLARELDVATIDQLRDGAGTPLYMAPEKIRGRHDDEVRCDIYAIGVTLHEAITLRHPIETPGGLDHHALMAFLMMRRWVPPSLSTAHVPRGLDTVLRRAMHGDPQKRYATAADLARELARFAERPRAQRTRQPRSTRGRQVPPPAPARPITCAG